MFNLVNRGELDGKTEHEFENHVSRLKGLWLVEHNEDGTHNHIDVSVIDGVLTEAMLPTNVAYTDHANIFTQIQTVLASISTAGPTGQLDVWPRTGLNDRFIWYNPNGTNLHLYNTLLGDCFNIDRFGLMTLYSGIQFPAVQVASAGSNTLDDYEEGTFTPFDSSGAGLVFVGPQGWYTKIGQRVFVDVLLLFPATASAAPVFIGGLPFTAGIDSPMIPRFTTLGFHYTINISGGTPGFALFTNVGANVTNAQQSGAYIACGGSYIVA